MKIKINDQKEIYNFTSNNNCNYLVYLQKDKIDRNGNKKFLLEFFYKANSGNFINFGNCKVFEWNTSENEIKRILNIAVEQFNEMTIFNLEKVEETEEKKTLF